MRPHVPLAARRALKRRLVLPRLRRLDDRPIPPRSDEVRLYLKVRNQATLLPYFLDYHRALGVDRFFAVDNGSDDGTVELLRARDDVHVFSTEASFATHQWWQNAILQRYRHGGWWLLLDPDELFVYPHMDELDLRGLLRYLESRQATAMHSVLLDLYPETSTSAPPSLPGRDPRHVAGFFDPPSFGSIPGNLRGSTGFGDRLLAGGARKRLFDVNVCCSKFPLLRVDRSMWVARGYHHVEHARIADVWGALLHFTLLPGLEGRARREAERGVYFRGGAEYRAYADRLAREGVVTYRDERSLRYRDPRQLLDLGVLRSSPALDRWAAAHVQESSRAGAQ